MGQAWTEQDFLKELNGLGEQEVRRRVRNRYYGSTQDDRTILAEKWLAPRDQEAERRNEASRAEQTRIARSAKNAAWAAAIAALAAVVAIDVALWQP
jgi:hypothetical protein